MMCAKIFILLFLAFTQTYAQPLPGTAEMITCGNVEIPPMTPAQIINPISWTLPGQIAASNCYTGFLQGSHQALNGMYNALYNAGPPSLPSRSKNKKDDGRSKKDSKKESNKKTKDRKETDGKKKQ